MRKRIFGLIVLLCAVSGIKAQNIAFKADINEMLPMSYPVRSGLSGFSLELRNDSAFVHLPYMGQVYNPVYGGDGTNFDEPYKGMKVTPTKKKDGRKLKFDVKHEFVTYRFDVTLWDNNNIDILMQPGNAQGCSYMGKWE